MQEDAWLREVKKQAEVVAVLDPRKTLSELERVAIQQAQIQLQLLAKIDRMRATQAQR